MLTLTQLQNRENFSKERKQMHRGEENIEFWQKWSEVTQKGFNSNFKT